MQVFKLGLPGKDVQRSGLADKVLDSSYPSPKINSFADPPHAGVVKINSTGNTTAPILGATNTLFSFRHGYDYVPTVFGNYILFNQPVTFPDQSNAGQLPEVFVNASAVELTLLVIEADLNNIYINELGLKATPTTLAPYIFYIRFYVMAESGKE